MPRRRMLHARFDLRLAPVQEVRACANPTHPQPTLADTTHESGPVLMATGPVLCPPPAVVAGAPCGAPRLDHILTPARYHPPQERRVGVTHRLTRTAGSLARPPQPKRAPPPERSPAEQNNPEPSRREPTARDRVATAARSSPDALGRPIVYMLWARTPTPKLTPKTLTRTVTSRSSRAGCVEPR